MNNKRAMYKFFIFYSRFFKISQIVLFWAKITIIIIEISLKAILHGKYWWNNTNSHRFGLKSQQLHFLAFLIAQKCIIHAYIEIQATGSIFIFKIYIFLNMDDSIGVTSMNRRWNIHFRGVTRPSHRRRMGIEWAWTAIPRQWMPCPRLKFASESSTATYGFLLKKTVALYW